MSEGGGDSADEAQSAIDEAAALWLVQLSDANLRVQAGVLAEFTRWSEADSRHAEAFARMKSTWAAVDRWSNAAEIAALRKEAVGELDQLRRRTSWKSGRMLALSAGVGLAFAATISVIVYLAFWPFLQTISTGIGERRTITLSDASVIELDADTSLSVAYSSKERLIHVLKGQAYFRVAKNLTRPFVVECHDRTVTATGTEFDVEALSQGLHVTLVQGHVRVAVAQTVIASLSPGDNLTIEVGRAPQLTHKSNMLALLAWRTGRLIFDDVPLTDAVASMSRYTRTSVMVDPSIAGLRISGVFKAGDLSGLIGAIKTFYPVSSETRTGSVILTRRP